MIFALVLMIGAPWWLAAVIAALMSMAISILTLDKLRSKAAEGLLAWRMKEQTEDSLIEDELIEENPDLLKREADPEANAI